MICSLVANPNNCCCEANENDEEERSKALLHTVGIRAEKRTPTGRDNALTGSWILACDLIITSARRRLVGGVKLGEYCRRLAGVLSAWSRRRHTPEYESSRLSSAWKCVASPAGSSSASEVWTGIECVCGYTYLHIHARTRTILAHTVTNTRACMHAYTHINTGTHAHKHVRTQTCTQARMQERTHSSTHIHRSTWIISMPVCIESVNQEFTKSFMVFSIKKKTSTAKM